MRSLYHWLELHSTARKLLAYLVFFGPMLIYLAVVLLRDE